MAGLINLDFGSIIKEGANAIGQFVTTDKEKMQLGLQDKALDVGLIKGQQTANIVAAKHKSIFVAGGRPFILWVCGCGLLWQYLAHPMCSWIFKLLQGFKVIPMYILVGKEQMLLAPPALDTEGLVTILMGVLGMSGFRTYEKLKGIHTDSLSSRAAGQPVKKSGKKPWHKKMFSKGD